MTDIKELRRLADAAQETDRIIYAGQWLNEWQIGDGVTIDEVANLIKSASPSAILSLLDKIDAQQAKIDALMLEYCLDEMTKEQMDEWARSQKVSEIQS